MSAVSGTRKLELLSRYALVAPLAQGKRVLDLGCPDGRGIVSLAQAEASELVAVASDVAAVQAALAKAGVEGVDVLPEPSLPLEHEDASFDLIVCHDLAERLAAEPALADELRRVLDPRGVLVAAVAHAGLPLTALNGETASSAMTYEQVFQALGPRFGAMSAFGQSPVAATLFFDLASQEEDPGLSLDRSLLDDEGEQPGWFVLVFGPEPYRRDDLTFVQLPFAELAEVLSASGAGGDAAAMQSELDRTDRALRAREAEVARLTLEKGELEEQLAAGAPADGESDALRARIAELEQQLAAAAPPGDDAELRQQLDEALAAHADAQSRLAALEATANERLLVAQSEAENEQRELVLRLSETEAREQELARRLTETERAHHELAERLAQAEAEQQERAQGLHEDEARQQELARRLAEAEGRLQEDAQRLAEAEARLQEDAQRLADTEARERALGERLGEAELRANEGVARLQAREGEIAQALTDAEARERELTEKLVEAEMRERGVSERLGQTEGRERELAQRLEAVAQHDHELAERLTETEARDRDLVWKLAEAQAREKEAAEQLGETQTRERELCDKLNAATAREREVGDKLAEAELRESQLGGRLADLELREADLADKVAQAEARERDRTQKLTEAEARERDRTQKLAEAEARERELLARLTETSTIEQEGTQKLLESEGRERELERRLTETEARERELGERLSEIERRERDNESAQGERIVALEAELRVLGDDLATRQRELEALGATKVQAEDALTRARKDGQSLEAQIKDLLDETVELRQITEGVQTELQQMIAERDALMARLQYGGRRPAGPSTPDEIVMGGGEPLLEPGPAPVRVHDDAMAAPTSAEPAPEPVTAEPAAAEPAGEPISAAAAEPQADEPTDDQPAIDLLRAQGAAIAEPAVEAAAAARPDELPTSEPAGAVSGSEPADEAATPAEGRGEDADAAAIELAAREAPADEPRTSTPEPMSEPPSDEAAEAPGDEDSLDSASSEPAAQIEPTAADGEELAPGETKVAPAHLPSEPEATAVAAQPSVGADDEPSTSTEPTVSAILADLPAPAAPETAAPAKAAAEPPAPGEPEPSATESSAASELEPSLATEPPAASEPTTPAASAQPEPGSAASDGANPLAGLEIAEGPGDLEQTFVGKAPSIAAAEPTVVAHPPPADAPGATPLSDPDPFAGLELAEGPGPNAADSEASAEPETPARAAEPVEPPPAPHEFARAPAEADELLSGLDVPSSASVTPTPEPAAPAPAVTTPREAVMFGELSVSGEFEGPGDDTVVTLAPPPRVVPARQPVASARSSGFDEASSASGETVNESDTAEFSAPDFSAQQAGKQKLSALDDLEDLLATSIPKLPKRS